MSQASVLIVDDEESVCESYSRFLESKGYATSVAANALQAVRACRNSEIDVVISDIQMPEMSGAELLREIRSEQPHLPVILMSGATDLRTALALLKEDAFDYLEKPVEPAELLATLGRALAQAEEARAKSLPEARNLGSIQHQNSKDRDDCSIVTAYAPLDVNSESTLTQPLRRLLHEGELRNTCVLRLGKVSYINNIGLNQLLAINQTLRNENHNLVIAEMQESVRRYLNLLGYLDYFVTAESVQEALIAIPRTSQNSIASTPNTGKR